MLWFLSRREQRLQIETRYDNTALEYVVTIQHPDGRRETERFGDQEACRRRLLELEQALSADDWTFDDPPTFLPGGWPAKRPPK